MRHLSTNVSVWSIAWLMSCRASYGISAVGKTQLRNRHASYLWLVAMSKVSKAFFFLPVYHWNIARNIAFEMFKMVSWTPHTHMQRLITAVFRVLSLWSWSVCFCNLQQMFEIKIFHRLYPILTVWAGQAKYWDYGQCANFNLQLVMFAKTC